MDKYRFERILVELGNQLGSWSRDPTSFHWTYRTHLRSKSDLFEHKE